MIEITTKQNGNKETESCITFDINSVHDMVVETVSLISALFEQIKEIDEELYMGVLDITIDLLTQMSKGDVPIPVKHMTERLN